MNQLIEPTETQFLLYQSIDGIIHIETRMQDESVWLTQEQMSELFNKSKSTINEHIKNIFSEGELIENDVMRKFGNSEFSTKPTHYYNLDVIISVGYRVKSKRGTQFRIWATQRLREYLIKGFVMDDERLKNAGRGNYFDELLARIRDIRSSEKVFWLKILDVYSTSIDYDKTAETSKSFFKMIQNKMHWAAHGHTAAEIIHQRADSEKPNMGMTNWVGATIRKNEAEIAKNYLDGQELDILNRIVTMYLEFAEMQALSQKPMTMNDWTKKLDDFLIISDRELLTHSGKISHETAINKVHAEYEKFHLKTMNQPSPIEDDFITFEKGLNRVELIHKQKEENSGIK